MWLAVAIPAMVLALAIAVVPVLVGSIRFHAGEGTEPTGRDPGRHLLPAVEVRGIEALERRLEAIERHLFAPSEPDEPAL